MDESQEQYSVKEVTKKKHTLHDSVKFKNRENASMGLGTKRVVILMVENLDTGRRHGRCVLVARNACFLF